jgi:hypothetical protein
LANEYRAYGHVESYLLVVRKTPYTDAVHALVKRNVYYRFAGDLGDLAVYMERKLNKKRESASGDNFVFHAHGVTAESYLADSITSIEKYMPRAKIVFTIHGKVDKAMRKKTREDQEMWEDVKRYFCPLAARANVSTSPKGISAFSTIIGSRTLSQETGSRTSC